jgi:hypothetical protein
MADWSGRGVTGLTLLYIVQQNPVTAPPRWHFIVLGTIEKQLVGLNWLFRRFGR